MEQRPCDDRSRKTVGVGTVDCAVLRKACSSYSAKRDRAFHQALANDDKSKPLSNFVTQPSICNFLFFHILFKMFKGPSEARLSVPSIPTTAQSSSSQDQPERPKARRANTAPSKVITGQKSERPDWVLVFCYMLVYLEVGWLITLIWRSLGKDWSPAT